MSNAEAGTKIMDAVQKSVGTYMTSVGITLDFIGWAGTFTFDSEVQKAIDDKYVAETIGPIMPTLQQAADIEIKRGLAQGVATHGLPTLPSWVFVPSDWANALSGWLHTKAGKSE